MATASPSTRRASAGTKDRPASRSWVRWGPAPPRKTRAPRLPVQAIYKFDDRRIVAGRIESGHLAAGDEIVIMPAGKIAKINTVEGWPVASAGNQRGAGSSVGITLDRELFVERGDIIGHVGN